MNTTIQAKTYDPTPPRRLAFLGLGVMGYPMAGHLALAGHTVTVYNRSAGKAEAWCAQLAATGRVQRAATPAAAAALVLTNTVPMAVASAAQPWLRFSENLSGCFSVPLPAPS